MPRGAQLLASAPGDAATSCVPVAAAHRELDREAALGGEARCERSCTTARRPGIAFSSLRSSAANSCCDSSRCSGGTRVTKTIAAVHRRRRRRRRSRRRARPRASSRGSPRPASTSRSVSPMSEPTAVCIRSMSAALVLRRARTRSAATSSSRARRRGAPPRRRAPATGACSAFASTSRVVARERVEAAVDRSGRRRPRSSREVLRICAQRAGASVIASRYESSTATQSVTPNWRKNCPMTPFMKTTGMKIATTASVAASAAKVISPVPSRAARDPVLPLLGVPEDVLQHHDRVVDDDADGEREPEQGEGVEREAEEVDDRDRAEERHRDREHHVERARRASRGTSSRRAR